MAYGDASEQIRERAWKRYIEPQIRQGQRSIRMPIKPLMKEMESDGFQTNRPRQFCTALQKREFLRDKKLVLNRVEGPPSGTSTTAVLHFHYSGDLEKSPSANSETAAQRAYRLTEKLRGRFKDEIAAHGGTEGFIRWIRSDDDEDAG